MSPIKTSSTSVFRNEMMMPREEMLAVDEKHQPLVIGIPKEQNGNEHRVALSPQAVQVLVNRGNKVLVESEAGKYANFQDIDYSEAGAQIEQSRQAIFESAIVLKVSPFSTGDIELLTGNQIVFSALHISTQRREHIQAMMNKRLTAIAFENICDDTGQQPVVRAMSEISGSSAIMIASEYLSTFHGGKGILLGGMTGIPPTEVVIIGAGTASLNAARTALGLGAMVKVFDTSTSKLRRLQEELGQRLYTSLLYPNTLEQAVQSADVVIGTIVAPENTFFYVNEQMVRKMKKGTVLIDLSIDQGGCFETSWPTTHKEPVFLKHDVVHYCVPNIAARVARTASMALSDIFGDILLNISNLENKNFLKKDNGLLEGVYIFNGILTNPKLGRKFNLNYKSLDLLRAAL